MIAETQADAPTDPRIPEAAERVARLLVEQIHAHTYAQEHVPGHRRPERLHAYEYVPFEEDGSVLAVFAIEEDGQTAADDVEIHLRPFVDDRSAGEWTPRWEWQGEPAALPPAMEPAPEASFHISGASAAGEE